MGWDGVGLGGTIRAGVGRVGKMSCDTMGHTMDKELHGKHACVSGNVGSASSASRKARTASPQRFSLPRILPAV